MAVKSFTPPPSFDLLRHGRTETDEIFRGQVDDPLSKTGWLQMEEAVAGEVWDQIICSPLSRCRLFASDLAQTLDLPLLVDDQFAEYHFGDWDGKRYSEVMDQSAELVERFFDDPFSCTPPNAERFADFHDRVLNAWEAALTNHTGKSVLIVTHGGVIMSVMASVLGLDRLHGRVDVGYANLTRIRPGTDGTPHRLISHGTVSR